MRFNASRYRAGFALSRRAARVDLSHKGRGGQCTGHQDDDVVGSPSMHPIQQLLETRIVAQRGEVGVVLDPCAMAPAEIDSALEQIECARAFAELRVRAAGVVE